MTVTCNTETCFNYGIEYEPDSEWREVRCGGQCGNTLREENESHPDYFEAPENYVTTYVPTIEDLVRQVLRQEGIIE